jgi:cytochrome c biogenesis protein ResB
LKRLLFILILILLTISLSGCYLLQSERSEVPIEMTAFSSLNDEEKDQIPVSPKDSVVRKVTVNDDLAKLIGKNYYGKKVYSVMFNHTETDSTENITVYVDLDKKEIVGKGYSH